MPDLAAISYLLYLLALLLVPLLVQWRWGLVATLMVTVVELVLVGLILYVMVNYHLLPDVYVGEPGPEPEHPFVKIRRGQAAGYLQLFFFGAVPAGTALVGGGLAVAGSIVHAVWRLVANRRSP